MRVAKKKKGKTPKKFFSLAAAKEFSSFSRVHISPLLSIILYHFQKYSLVNLHPSITIRLRINRITVIRIIVILIFRAERRTKKSLFHWQHANYEMRTDRKLRVNWCAVGREHRNESDPFMYHLDEFAHNFGNLVVTTRHRTEFNFAHKKWINTKHEREANTNKQEWFFHTFRLHSSVFCLWCFRRIRGVVEALFYSTLLCW